MDKPIRTIDVLLFDGVNLLDVAGPVQAFVQAYRGRQAAYRVAYVALPDQSDTTASLSVRTSCNLVLQAGKPASLASTAQDLLIPGGKGVDALLGNRFLQQLICGWQHQRTDARLISICSGALLLADAGVLDGRTATTHWGRESQVLQHFPDVDWDLNRILAEDDNRVTSAGVTTGIDLALNLIKKDCGPDVALAVARELVVSLKRSGGQNQFTPIIEWQLMAESSIASLVTSLVDHPERSWTLEMMANECAVTPRTLARKFHASFNTSPVKFLEQVRVRIAGDLLGAGMPVEQVVRRAGFTDTQMLRRACKRQLDTTLGDYIRKFSDG